MFINKYQKTLKELTQLKPSVQQPTKQREITKKKVPTYIPPEIFRIILSFLPTPVIKPLKYGIMNNKVYDGSFMIITKITPKFVVYDTFEWLENGMTICRDRHTRSKLRKDKTRRCYYIKYKKVEYRVDNNLPVKICVYEITETRFYTTEEYRKTLKWCHHYYSQDLPIKIGDY